MASTRTLVLVLAGGAGGRLELLTRERAKPAVPYAGTHRLIDFPLSNCHNAGIEDVWVAQQFNPASLSDHLANGRPWDLDRTDGGLLVLQPHLGHDDRTGFQTGTADSLWRNAPLIREFAPHALVVVSADAIYRLDYEELVDEHLESGAELTIVTTEVARDDAGRYGVVQVDGERVTDYAYKPEEPKANIVANEVFVFTPRPVLDVLEDVAAESDESHLDDLGDDLLPRIVAGGRARAHHFDGYWRDVGTVTAYWESHQELLADDPPITLDDPDWPILTRAIVHRSAAHVRPGADIGASMLAPGARVAGTVEGSVIGRGALVEAGAVVRDSILLPGAVVRSGAEVHRAILDDRVEVCDGASVGEPAGDIALVGLAATVEPGTRLGAGARLPEVDD